jgi:hypothetical protein
LLLLHLYPENQSTIFLLEKKEKETTQTALAFNNLFKWPTLWTTKIILPISVKTSRLLYDNKLFLKLIVETISSESQSTT